MTLKGGFRALQSAVTAVLDFAVPLRCHGCGTIVSKKAGFCPPCWSKLPFLAGPACAQCALPFDVQVADGTRCGQCLAKPPPWSSAASLWLFDGAARDAVHALKYHDRTDLTQQLAQLLARAGERIISPDTVLVPVPLHRWRMAKRTFNQSALLATSLAAQCGGTANLLALERHRATAPQQGLDRTARAQNVKKAFRLNPRHAAALSGRIVVLIDDVYTTGATLEACAQVLLRGGAQDVRILTLARVVPGRANAI
jgi:ComF family protein